MITTKRFFAAYVRLLPVLSVLWSAVLIATAIFFFTHINGRAFDTDLAKILPRANDANARYVAKTVIDSHSNHLLLATVFDSPPHQRVLAELSASIDEDVLIPLESNTLDAQLYQLLFPYRQQLLTPTDRRYLRNGQLHIVTNNARHKQYTTGTFDESKFRDDPLYLFERYYLHSLPKLPSIRMRGRWIQRQHEGQTVLVLPVQLTASPFDTAYQQRVKAVLNKLEKKLAKHGACLHPVGALMYAAHGFERANQEMSTVGLGGLLGIIVLLLYAFRAMRPTLILVTSLGLSLVVALQSALWLLGSLHIVSLLMSVAIIGVSVDYGFHFLSDYYQHNDRAVHSVRRIISSLTLGMLSTVMAYATFTFSDFSLLKEVAVMALLGLPSMYLTVVLVLPFWHRRTNTARHMPPALRRFAALLSRNPVARRFSQPAVFFLALLVMLSLGYATVTPNDEVRDLQSLSKQLKEEEDFVRQIFKQPTVTHYVLISTDKHAAEQLLAAEQHLIGQYPQAFRLDTALNTLLPSEMRQRDNHQLYQRLYGSDVAQTFDPDWHEFRDFSLKPFQPMPINELLQNPILQRRFEHQLLTLPSGDIGLLLPLRTNERILNADYCTDMIGIVQCQFISPTNELSDKLGEYRRLLSKYLLLSSVLMMILLAWRYGRHSVLVALLPAFAAVCGVVFSAWVGVSISLFSILAALLVLGMGLDYVIFMAETQQPECVMVSLILSYATTLLSFGLLFLSDTAAVSTFGLTTAIGITVILLLSPAVRKDWRDKQHLETEKV
ncbi:MAG: hypothetical protein CR974_01440 [Gammaproteobacteria bacterium]|nr:MAG: hypothetical protein CR974_01440 [Gammaproteobacteria bacterium]